MKRQLRRYAALALLPAAAAACEGTQTVPENERFSASLSGANEVPAAVSTAASGVAEFEALPDGTIDYSVDVQNMTGILMGHIHGPAGATANAGVLVWLYPEGATSPGSPTGAVSGRLARGSFGAAQVTGMGMDSLVVLMRTGNVYVNLHTSANRGGEIRGQIRPR